MKDRSEPLPTFSWLQEDDEGVNLYVLTQADAVDNRYMGIDGKFLKIQVRAPDLGTPAANRMVTECISDLLRVEPASVQVVGGSHTSKKTIRVPGMTQRLIRLRLGV